MAEEKRVEGLSKERQGEIAMACLKYLLRKRGFTLNSQIKRELGNSAKELGIDPEELKAFLKPLVQEILDEALS
ncbi:MAG: hypothetical protein NT116_04120 [Candidatus Parcubacteria bacterium]|nr:hypothetical protein [Candidatus Parcubacteria bacterium]